MIIALNYSVNKANWADITEHLRSCEVDFQTELAARVEIQEYAQKIASKAMRFEAWAEEILVGLVAIYCNDMKTRIAHVTNVTVLRKWAGKGIASVLMEQCILNANEIGMHEVGLEVRTENIPTIKLYEKIGFVAVSFDLRLISMKLGLIKGTK